MNVLITGAAGFIGSRLVDRLAKEGHSVVGIDNCSRRGSRVNFDKIAGSGLEIHEADVADRDSLQQVLSNHKSFDSVFHLAGQVAVTTSYDNPSLDFESNARGSFVLFKEVVERFPEAHLVYSSTNKVFGSEVFDKPVDDSQTASPYSPYGVSKFVGDLYLEEFRRPPFGLSSTSLRQSCVYGPGQLGVEDQGWVAWFTIANLSERPITVFGDGNQVRDLLYIDDLLDLYLSLMTSRLNGSFVVGGGHSNAWSVAEVIAAIPGLTGKPFSKILFSDSRPGDQPYFVSSNRALFELCGWTPSTPFSRGGAALVSWLLENQHELESVGIL